MIAHLYSVKTMNQSLEIDTWPDFYFTQQENYNAYNYSSKTFKCVSKNYINYTYLNKSGNLIFL